MNKTNVEQNVMEEVLKDCNFYERVIVKVHPKTCIKIYKKGLQDGFNWNNKNIDNF